MQKVQDSRLAIFQPPPIEFSIEKREWIKYLPENGLQVPFSFHIPGTSSTYIDLNKSRLVVVGHFLHKDGTNIVASEQDIKPTNAFLHSMFIQADVSLQQKIISPNISINYPYKAIMDLLVNYDDVIVKPLSSEMFYVERGDLEKTNNVKADCEELIVKGVI